MQKLTYSFLTSSRWQLMANIFSSGAPQFFPSSAVILLVVWFANGDCGASSKVNLLNDDTYRCDYVTIIMSSFGQIEQGARIRIHELLNEESVSGVRSSRASL